MHAHDSSSSSLNPSDPQDAELIEFFISELPVRMKILRSAIHMEDFEGIQRIAHQLKGSAPSYGFSHIGAAAETLERSVRDSCTQSLGSIQSELNALINLCDSYAKESRDANA